MNDRADEVRSTRAPKLREDQIEVLSRYGEIRTTEVGEVLFRAGDTSNNFIVVLEGEVEVIEDFVNVDTSEIEDALLRIDSWR